MTRYATLGYERKTQLKSWMQVVNIILWILLLYDLQELSHTITRDLLNPSHERSLDTICLSI